MCLQSLAFLEGRSRPPSCQRSVVSERGCLSAGDWWGNNGGRKWRGGRGPQHSVNFITAHDGFTMSDMVAYNKKHNEANGEGNR